MPLVVCLGNRGIDLKVIREEQANETMEIGSSSMSEQHFKFVMPDLSSINTPAMPDTAMGIIIGKWAQRNDQVWLYIHNLIRITDKAIFEYEAARKSYLKQLDTLRNGVLPLSALFRSVAHLETCINSVRRALRFIERLNGYEGEAAISRTTRKIIRIHAKVSVNIRDVVEHMDEMIADGSFVKGKAPMLMLTESGDGACIADYSIQFGDLASLLRKLKELAIQLSETQAKESFEQPPKS